VAHAGPRMQATRADHPSTALCDAAPVHLCPGGVLRHSGLGCRTPRQDRVRLRAIVITSLSVSTLSVAWEHQRALTETLLREAAEQVGGRRQGLLRDAVVQGTPMARSLALRYDGRRVNREELFRVAREAAACSPQLDLAATRRYLGRSVLRPSIR
jgi:hypothetical protein